MTVIPTTALFPFSYMVVLSVLRSSSARLPPQGRKNVEAKIENKNSFCHTESMEITEIFFQMTVMKMTALFLTTGIKVCFCWKNLKSSLLEVLQTKVNTSSERILIELYRPMRSPLSVFSVISVWPYKICVFCDICVTITTHAQPFLRFLASLR